MSTYSKEFQEEAIRPSDEIGNKKAAARFGILYYTPAARRNRSKHKPKTGVTDISKRLWKPAEEG